MAFGQQTGPPASHRQLEQLLDLLHAAGHDGFRDARGPMGFTQRQAGGKFTTDEADVFIEQLREVEPGEPDSSGPAVKPERLTAAERVVRDLPVELLAAELQRRGWIVIEP